MKQAFICSNTAVLSPPLVPEVKLHLAHEAVPLWQKTEEELGSIGLPPPFWAFAWAGGQALARYILDHRSVVSGKTVLDLASGSGLVGISAGLAGASSVLAAEIDAFAIAAIELNAALNQVAVETTHVDLLASPPPLVDVITVGDLFYEKSLSERCFSWLKSAQTQGIAVLIGDPGRSYFPQDHCEQIAVYNVPVSRDLEDQEIKRSAVWRLKT